MVPFKPYFVGEEPPPYPRAMSVQKCVRAGGKHNDLDDIGRTNRHFTFFEMLGNFSFGDYFKAEAIPLAWELFTEVLGLDPERLWVTVHETDDEAERIWRDVVGVPAERIQRLGDDNFWRMADTGPCGPTRRSSGTSARSTAPTAGPPGGEDRYVEIWNLVFMQFDEQPDGELLPLPGAEHRHRRRPRAQPRGPAGRRVGLGHRRVPPAHRRRRGTSPASRTPGSPAATATCRCGSSPSTGAR